MREIKFKGKAIMTNEELDSMHFIHDNGWFVGNLIQNGNEPWIVGDIVESDPEYIVHDFWVRVDPKSVRQYTGLKDKNGQEVYEGDVIDCNYMGFQKWKGTVKFGEYEQDGSGGEYSPTECVGFYADAIDKNQTDEFNCKFISDYLETVSLLDFKEIEVIGNIYQHPHLLEGECE